jgi:hypothetical protein
MKRTEDRFKTPVYDWQKQVGITVGPDEYKSILFLDRNITVEVKINDNRSETFLDEDCAELPMVKLLDSVKLKRWIADTNVQLGRYGLNIQELK